jgi:hypothetical protein
MLKTNSEKARKNLENYITVHTDFSNYDGFPAVGFPDLCRRVLDIFHAEMQPVGNRAGMSEPELFNEWAMGLPAALDTCYYYNRSAVDDLGGILEQSQAERSKYSERQSEKLLTSLLYRELKKNSII